MSTLTICVNLGRDDTELGLEMGENPKAHSESIVASSSSMTGMSSLIGYTRRQLGHFSASPLGTTETLHSGQTRISSNSLSIMARILQELVDSQNHSFNQRAQLLFRSQPRNTRFHV